MVVATYETPSICVVEDSEDDLLALIRALKRLEIPNPLLHFDKGEQVLGYLSRENDRLSNIGLMLLDINLPGMDGISLLKAIRSNNNLLSVPVIMFSTSDAPGDIQRSYLAGANAFVTKPVASGGFTEAIDSILSFWLKTARLPLSYFEEF